MSRVQLMCRGPSRTKQSFKKECDINEIIKKFKRTIGVDYLSRYQGYVDGRFGNFTGVVDYRTALEQVAQADKVFMGLPAQLRARFRNSAAEFLDFVQRPENVDEMIKLGLATKREKVSTPPAPGG